MTRSTGRRKPAASTSREKTVFQRNSTTRSFGKVSRERLLQLPKPASRKATLKRRQTTTNRPRPIANRWDHRVPPIASGLMPAIVMSLSRPARRTFGVQRALVRDKMSPLKMTVLQFSRKPSNLGNPDRSPVYHDDISRTVDRLRAELNLIGLKNHSYFRKKIHRRGENQKQQWRADRLKEIKVELERLIIHKI